MTSILVGISCSTFNNISIISLLSDMTVEEMETTDENHRYVISHWQTLSQQRRLKPVTDKLYLNNEG